MKINFYLESNKGYSVKSGQNFLWQKFLTGVLVLAILFFSLNLFRSQIRNYFYLLYSNVSGVFLNVGKNFSSFLQSLDFNRLKKDNNNLKEENQKLMASIFVLQELINNDQNLKEALKSIVADNFSISLAKVVGLDLENDLILINKGSEDGILENMPLISSQKVLYGKVFKTYKNFSQVMLISNKSSVLNVKVSESGPNKIATHGSLKGKGSLSLYLDTVSSQSEVKEGDILVTSALEGIFPAGLLIGKVTAVNNNDLKPFQKAEVEQFFDIKNINSLFVITSYLKN